MGVMAFFMQIRDVQTNEPLPGIMVGDLGDKLGYNTKDNGWLIMNKVRIPRTNQLSRFMEVDKEGSLEIKSNPKAMYATMVVIRTLLVCNAGVNLRRALLIAIRYAVCRRQFKN